MKNLVQFIIFALLVYVLVGLLEYAGAFREHEERAEQKQRHKEFVGKFSRVEQFSISLEYSLDQLGMSQFMLLGMMVLCCGAGYLLGLILLMDAFLAIVAGGAAMFLPFVFLQLQSDWRGQNTVEKLEASMMCVTNAYIAGNDLIKAVQDNISIMEYPAPFEGFLADVNFIDASIERALRRMEIKVNNPYFSQWINILIQAQHDHNTAAMANVPIKQMNAVRRKQIEADATMAAQWREFFQGVALVCCIPVIFRVIMYQWYLTLVTTTIGRALMVAEIISIGVAITQARKINRPITLCGGEED